MSADSQKRSHQSTTVCLTPNIVPPQAVSDRSIIDSVAGFINDVALTNAPQTDPKDHILWVKFESTADISDPCLGDDWDVEGNLPPPLLLILGYGNGVQIWAIPANGEAIEVLSWRHSVVKTLRILPTPVYTNNGELAIDQFIQKRPLMAICSETQVNFTPGGPQSCAVNFVSLKDGEQVKSIKFKSPIIDILANRTSIVITFSERIAVFDARTFEDRLTVTTCFPCPGLNPNPVTLGDRWIAYAEKKLIASKRSSGGCDFDGVSSYTATMLNAAKSLGKGLRELGEHVAAGLSGSNSGNTASSGAGSGGNICNSNADGSQAGCITILDIKHAIKDVSPTTGTPVAVNGNDPIVAHFLAHSEAVVALAFDPSGMILLSADRRGHDFNVFRIQPHPCGSTLAAVHHLYVLHRGDTTSKVQDIAFSFDSRWVAVSTLRGTTHVFPITPYGGPAGVRTHGSAHVVNRLSRFHRSAGLSVDGRSSSPILMAENSANQSISYTNPRLPPFPHPTVILPLAQLRQPTSLGNATGTQQNAKVGTNRQRHTSTSEDQLAKPLRVSAIFGRARSWLLEPPGVSRENPVHRIQKKPIDSLFVMAGHGALIQYDLEPKHASNIPKEKVCDDTQIELDVEAKAQWYLQRQNTSIELSPPLPKDNWLIKDRLIDNSLHVDTYNDLERAVERDDRWLSQVEIITHAGPHRRLWMGPQFMFKTYNTPSGNSLSSIDAEAVEIGSILQKPRTNPMNMPTPTTGKPLVPVLIESGSCSSHEQSPRLLESFGYESIEQDIVMGPVESQLREDLADAMKENLGIPMQNNEEPGLDAINLLSTRQVIVSVAKVVNPQGTVTTLTASKQQAEPTQLVTDQYLHENCDESLFRPVVTVLTDAKELEAARNAEKVEGKRPTNVTTQLIVPVFDENLEKVKEKEKQDKQKKIMSQPTISNVEDGKPGAGSVVSKVGAGSVVSKVEDSKPIFSESTKKNRKLSKNEMKYNKKDKYAKESSPPVVLSVPQPALVVNATTVEPIKSSAEKQRKSALIENESSMINSVNSVVASIVEKDQDKPKKEKLKKTPSIEKKPEPKIDLKAPELEITDKTQQNSKYLSKNIKPVKDDKLESKSSVKLRERSASPVEKEEWDDASFEEILEQTPALLIQPFENDEIEIVDIYEDPPTIPDFVPQNNRKAKSEEKDMRSAKIDGLAKAKSVETPEISQFLGNSISFLKYSEDSNKAVFEEQGASISIQDLKVCESSLSPAQLTSEVDETMDIDIRIPAKSIEQVFTELKELQQNPELLAMPKTPPPEEPKAAKSKVDNPKSKKGYKSKFIKLSELQPATTPSKEQKIKEISPIPDPEDELLTMEFLALAPLEDVPLLDDHQNADENVIMKISMHQSIGDDDIEIVPHKNILSIQEPVKVSSKKSKSKKNGKKVEIKSEDFYNMQINLDELPPLEPLAAYDTLAYDKPEYDFQKNDGNNNQNAEATANSCLINLESPEAQDQKEQIQKKLSELLNDTNMIFAMCSSLKEMSVDSTSQILTSTSSSTTTTTTTTFATDSASSTQLEPLDCDYKSLELEMEENFLSSNEEKISTPEEEVSSPSSDESSKNQPNVADDEELRPLLTSISSLNNSLSPLSQAPQMAEPVIPLPDIQKQPPLAASSTSVIIKKKFNKKKKR